MKLDRLRTLLLDVILITFGGMLFSFAFVVFLAPNEINAGGVSGAAMVFVELTDIGSVGVISMIVNIPLFVIGYKSVGGKFFLGSLLGMLSSSLMIDVFALLPALQIEPLVGAIFGGLLSGLGLGLVFSRGASTGGVDIIARLLKRKFRNISMGRLMLSVDGLVVALTGVAFGNLNASLYCLITLYLSSVALDGVVYGFEFSKVALIISDEYEKIVHNIDVRLGRGATYLKGEGSYEHTEKMVVLCAVKRHQLAELKDAVVEVDPNAFVIVQEAHQVLGSGFERHLKDSL